MQTVLQLCGAPGGRRTSAAAPSGSCGHDRRGSSVIAGRSLAWRSAGCVGCATGHLTADIAVPATRERPGPARPAGTRRAPTPGTPARGAARDGAATRRRRKPPGTANRCDGEVVAPRVLRRLTTAEFEATVRAAFALDAGRSGRARRSCPIPPRATASPTTPSG